MQDGAPGLGLKRGGAVLFEEILFAITTNKRFPYSR